MQLEREIEAEPVVTALPPKREERVVGDEIHDRVDELQAKWGIRMIRLKKGQYVHVHVHVHVVCVHRIEDIRGYRQHDGPVQFATRSPAVFSQCGTAHRTKISYAAENETWLY